jgi:hypothetical protein
MDLRARSMAPRSSGFFTRTALDRGAFEIMAKRYVSPISMASALSRKFASKVIASP